MKNKNKIYYPKIQNIKKEITVKIRKKGEKEIEDAILPVKNIHKYIENNNFQINPPDESIVKIDYSISDYEGCWSWHIERDWRKCSKSNPKIERFNKDYNNKKTWKEIKIEKYGGKQKHKEYLVENICKEAIERINELELEDFIYIFRFRLENLFRFYGFRVGNNFLALWHDPKHKIYPIKD